jgi:hypothetical protein
MVRKGSPVRVRQRALGNALQHGVLVSGAARVTSSGRFPARSGQALDRSAQIAAVITAEEGKPPAEAEGEVRYAAGLFEWYAGDAERI